MEKVLAYLVSFYGVVEKLATWTIENPDTATLVFLIINFAVQKSSFRGSSDLFTLAKDIGKFAVERARQKKLR